MEAKEMSVYEISGTREVDGDERQFEAQVEAEVDDSDSVANQVRDVFLDSVENPEEFTVEEVQ